MTRSDDSMKWLLFSLAFGLAACSGASSQNAPRASDLDDAQDIAAYFYGQHLSRFGDHPLHRAANFEDTLEILRADNIALFPTGIRVAVTLRGVKGRAMVAQLELAWGEALGILGVIQLKVLAQFETFLRAQEEQLAAGKMSDAEEKKFNELLDAVDETRALAGALIRVGEHRVQVGGEAARQVIEEFPKSYLGYRVAADYYRLTGRWDAFDQVMTRLQQLNPVSVGLAFQKGAAALQRKGDLDEALRWFNIVLSRDGQFTRASVHRLMSMSSYIDFEREFQRFRSKHPDHQLVLWTAPLVGRLHQLRLGEPDLRTPLSPR